MSEKMEPNPDWIEGISLDLESTSLIQDKLEKPYTWEKISDERLKTWNSDEYIPEDQLTCKEMDETETRMLTTIFHLSVNNIVLQDLSLGIKKKKGAFVAGIEFGAAFGARNQDELISKNAIIAARNKKMEKSKYNRLLTLTIQKVNQHLEYIKKPLVPNYNLFST